GNATIDMQSTGGTVCTLGGNEGYTFGPADGTLQIKNPTGNVIDIGALDNTQALHNITVQNLEVVSGIPGDFINFKANNYTVSPNVAPYIVRTTVRHCSNYPAITGVVGRCVRFNLNAVGPEANLNGLTVECCTFDTGSTTVPVFIQSSLSGSGKGSIGVPLRDCTFNQLAGSASSMVDVDSATTAQNTWGVVLENCAPFAVTGTAMFSSTLVSNLLANAHLVVNGMLSAYENRKLFD